VGPGTLALKPDGRGGTLRIDGRRVRGGAGAAELILLSFHR
jgi:hypothetical protein